MPYKVLVVDDSGFFQVRLKDIINEHPELTVVGIASNGREAIEKAASLKPDVISMDYEMPFMDGVSAVKVIMEQRPVPIVMFSSMTYEGARITLDALDAGAVDFMNKNFAEVSGNSAVFKKKLHEKLIAFARNANPGVARAPKPESAPFAPAMSQRRPLVGRAASADVKDKTKIVLIGASTGGPVALADIITALPEDFPLPIVVIQHMPENFTRAFSDRLNRQSALHVSEAQSGDRLERGRVLVAPGGKQMMIDRSGETVKIIAGDDRVNYKPCVDITFASAAAIYGEAVLAMVLTGMGADGCEGARLLKEKGAQIWSQDRQSSVVYGMPAAVEKAGLSNCVIAKQDIAKKLIETLC